MASRLLQKWTIIVCLGVLSSAALLYAQEPDLSKATAGKVEELQSVKEAALERSKKRLSFMLNLWKCPRIERLKLNIRTFTDKAPWEQDLADLQATLEKQKPKFEKDLHEFFTDQFNRDVGTDADVAWKAELKKFQEDYADFMVPNERLLLWMQLYHLELYMYEAGDGVFLVDDKLIDEIKNNLKTLFRLPKEVDLRLYSYGLDVPQSPGSAIFSEEHNWGEVLFIYGKVLNFKSDADNDQPLIELPFKYYLTDDDQLRIGSDPSIVVRFHQSAGAVNRLFAQTRYRLKKEALTQSIVEQFGIPVVFEPRITKIDDDAATGEIAIVIPSSFFGGTYSIPFTYQEGKLEFQPKVIEPDHVMPLLLAMAPHVDGKSVEFLAMLENRIFLLVRDSNNPMEMNLYSGDLESLAQEYIVNIALEDSTVDLMTIETENNSVVFSFDRKNYFIKVNGLLATPIE